MWVLYLIAGIVCGAIITITILYLLSMKNSNKDNIEYVTVDPELVGHSATIEHKCLACPNPDEFTCDQLECFNKEDSLVEDLTLDETAAENDDLIIDELIALQIQEANKETLEYIQSGKKNEVPALRFTLSREDVFDYMEDKEGILINEGKSVFPSVIVRTKKHYCDSLHCGKWCFGLMWERKGVIKFTLRLDENVVKDIKSKHPVMNLALFPAGENWYDLVIDQSFNNKQEVYDILDMAFNFVFEKYYKEVNGVYKTDEKAARYDLMVISNGLEEAVKLEDPAYDEAIIEYEKALLKYRQKKVIPFIMTRTRMLRYVQRTFTLEGEEVVSRSKQCLPASLKSKGKVYALVYEKMYLNNFPDNKTNSYVSMTVRISDVYAKWLALRHPEVCRAAFPKNRNWYVVPVDGSFSNARMVYRVLKNAKKFVESN